MAHQKNSEIFHEHQYLAKIFHDPFKISSFPLRSPSPTHTHTHTHTHTYTHTHIHTHIHTHTHTHTHTYTHHYILHVLALITFLKVQPFYDFFLLLMFTFLKNTFINEPVLPIFMISSNFSFDITNILILLHSWGLSPCGRCERRPEP